MGRIKTTQVKRAGRKLVGLHGPKFSADFTSNNKLVDEMADIKSKKLRNTNTGYVTRLVRRQQSA